MREGTIVDATLIAAPPSTKNKDGKRDAEMHQSKKGNDWHFGMKAHVGVDASSGLVHTVVGTAGNVADVTQAHVLLHGDETAALGDAGYQGGGKTTRESRQNGNVARSHEALQTQVSAQEQTGAPDGKAGASEGERSSKSRVSVSCF